MKHLVSIFIKLICSVNAVSQKGGIGASRYLYLEKSRFV